MKPNTILIGGGLLLIGLVFLKRKSTAPAATPPVVLNPTILNMTQEQLANWITQHMYGPQTQEQQEQYNAAVDYYNANGTSEGGPSPIKFNLPTFTLPL